MTAPTPGGSTKAYKTSTSNRNINSDVCVAAHFAQPRGWVAGSPNPVKDNKGRPVVMPLGVVLKMSLFDETQRISSD